MTEITQILSELERGQPHAAAKLLPLVYDELSRLAAWRLANERPGQILEATALVHEAYPLAETYAGRWLEEACQRSADSAALVPNKKRNVDNLK